MKGNLNYCQVCGWWLGPDDFDGICAECDDEICENCGGEGNSCPYCNGTGKEPQDTQPTGGEGDE